MSDKAHSFLPPPTPDQAALLDRERIAELFTTGRTAYFISPVNAAILTAIVWTPELAATLLTWLAASIVPSVYRFQVGRAYSRGAQRFADPRAWERRFALGTALSGLAWGIGAILFFPGADVTGQIAIVCVICGSLMASAGLYAASSRSFFGFCVPVVLCSFWVLASQRTAAHSLIALMVVIFSAVLFMVFRQVGAAIEHTLRARIENEALVDEIARSEMRLADAIAGAPVGMAVFDQNHELLICNDEYARLYSGGEAADSLVGRSYIELCRYGFDLAEQRPSDSGPSREAWVATRFERFLAGDGTVRQFRSRDGRWLQSRILRTGMQGRVVIFSDVTEIKRAEAAYRAILDEENIVLEILPVGLAFVQNRVLVRCNRRLEQMLGYAPGELVGRSTSVWYESSQTWKERGKGFYDRLRSGGIVEDAAEFVRKDGSRVWCQAYARAIDPANPEASTVFAFADADERRAAERALRRSETLYRNLVETSNDLIWSIDSEGRWSYLNRVAVQRIWGCEPADLLGRHFSELVVPELRERELAVFGRVSGGEQFFDHEVRHVRRDGSTVDLSFNAIPLRDTNGAIFGATGTARDITGAKLAAAALHESVEKLRLAVDAADLDYWEWDAASDTMIQGRNPAAPGLSLATGVRRWTEWVSRVHPDDRERFRAAMAGTLERGEPYAVDFRTADEGGPVRWLSSRGKLMADAEGRPLRMIGVSQDITERKRQEEEVRYLAYHDTLTGLPNRRLLDDRLTQYVYVAQRREARLAVMAIDLDRFKSVNDTLGHKAGDAVLREVARRLATCVRKSDTLARQGGDEFVVVMTDLAQASDCALVAEKVLRVLAPEFLVDGRGFSIGASIGISLFPGDAGDGETLLRNADVAMYRAKELGRNNFRFFSR